MKSNWEKNYYIAENIFTEYVNSKEQFYTCPECGELIYKCDWDDYELKDVLCPICEFSYNE